MAYRNGTYVAFHANGTSEPGESDMKYYRLLQAWHAHDHHEFSIANSHDKTAAVRDSSSVETLKRRLRERLASSKNMLLILGKTTKFDADWIPFEIRCAVDDYKIPILVAYTAYSAVPLNSNLVELRTWWPLALESRIDDGTARTLHISFKQKPIDAAIDRYDMNNLPPGPISMYPREAYINWGILAS
jgi:hypothetical protein